MLSGNRNFPGRVHPDLDLGVLMSPPLVIAFALAGNAEMDLSREPVQLRADGMPVSNLIGMGILPLRLPTGGNPATLAIAPRDCIEIDARPQLLQPRCQVAVTIVRASGAAERLQATAAIKTQLETTLLRHGGVMPFILQKTMAEQQGREF